MALVGSPPRITKGSIETLPIVVTDSLSNLLDFTGTDLRYDLYLDDDDETEISTNNACVNDGMTALPLIDTTSLEEGRYSIFLHFTNGSETPRLGPFKFWVDD